MTIGQHINLVRFKYDLNLDEFADKVGVSKNTLMGWIYQGNSPKIELLIQVADALDMSLDDLVGRKRGTVINVKNTFTGNLEQMQIDFDNLLKMREVNDEY